MTPTHRLAILAAACSALVAASAARGEDAVYAAVRVHDALPGDQWRRIDESVDRGLEFLARSQQRDGSVPSSIGAQPGVTSLAVMAFLSRGHRPGAGPYGEFLERGIDYVLACQESSGLLALDQLPVRPSDGMVHERRPHTATYNHAISGLMLGEAYGQGDEQLNKKLRPAIESALGWARRMQKRTPRYPEDRGGWRYLHPGAPGKPASDLSATGWFIMFYRSARNAEFDVPEQFVHEAVAFVERCHDPSTGGFFYGPNRRDHLMSRGMTGAGLLTLTIGGRRDERIARAAGDWLLDHPFDRYHEWIGGHDRFHYGAYYCSQAMYLLGGDYWRRFYPTLARTLTDNQRGDGGWDYEHRYNDQIYGRTYTTSLAVLALTPPYQLLPIYQR